MAERYSADSEQESMEFLLASGIERRRAPKREDMEPIVQQLYEDPDLADKLIPDLLESEKAYLIWWGAHLARHAKVSHKDAAGRAYIEFTRVHQQVAHAPIVVDIGLKLIDLRDLAGLERLNASGGDAYDRFIAHTDIILEDALQAVIQKGEAGDYKSLWKHAEVSARKARKALVDNKLLDLTIFDIEGTTEDFLRLSLITNRETSSSMILMEAIGHLANNSNLTADELREKLRDGFTDATAWERGTRKAFGKAIFGKDIDEGLRDKINPLAQNGLSLWAKAMQGGNGRSG